MILFVYSIGLQVGPSFFSSFGQGGIKLNILAISIVLLSCVTAYLIHLFSGEDIATMTGVLFGAVTNTPGLGAAQQAFTDITGEVNANIASGYAMAYPLGVVGIITVILAMRWFFNIKIDKEEQRVAAENGVQKEIAYIDILLTNPQVEGAHIRDLSQLCHMDLIVSRLVGPDGEDELPDVDTVLHVGDRIRVVVDKENEKSILLLGMETSLPTDSKAQAHLVSRHVVVTKAELNGKRIGDLNIRATYHVSITRIRRAGIELLATRDLRLQLGDRITVDEIDFDVLHIPDISFGKQMNVNDSSVVYKMTYDKGQTVMFLGDAEWIGSNDLVDNHAGDLKSDVVQVGHHGCGSCSDECYRLIGAKAYIWQCGERFWYQDCGEGLNTHNVGFIHYRTMMKSFGIKDENVYVSLWDIDSLPLPMPIY